MTESPLVSVWYLSAFSPPNHKRRRLVTCGAAMMIECPRGDLNPHALNGH